MSGHEPLDLVVLEVSKDMSILFGGFSGRGRGKEISGSLFKLSRLNLILLHIVVGDFCGVGVGSGSETSGGLPSQHGESSWALNPSRLLSFGSLVFLF